jgi:hypothetical protein
MPQIELKKVILSLSMTIFLGYHLIIFHNLDNQLDKEDRGGVFGIIRCEEIPIPVFENFGIPSSFKSEVYEFSTRKNNG